MVTRRHHPRPKKERKRKGREIETDRGRKKTGKEQNIKENKQRTEIKEVKEGERKGRQKTQKEEREREKRETCADVKMHMFGYLQCSDM